MQKTTTKMSSTLRTRVLSCSVVYVSIYLFMDCFVWWLKVLVVLILVRASCGTRL
jgi:hypothetical protein